MASKVSWPTITCVACLCVDGGRPCDICVHFNFNCKGTCTCCVENRKATPSTSKGQGTSSVTKQGPEPVCKECDCLNNSMPCRKCVRGNLKCTGTCPCCAKSQEKNTITIDEKSLDSIISNSVITPIKLKNNPVLLVPWETYNTLTTPSAQQPPAPKKIVFRKPPSRHVSESPNKNMRSILCTQCFCEADEIPCEICCLNDSYCRGSCPCCDKRSRQKILDPQAKNEYDRKCLSDPICPRCTRTPGEGSCHFCLKIAEEKAAALARLKSKKRRRPKPAILQHKKKEYCLHCDCKRGSEPCLACRNSTCYGNCVCCHFNRKLIDSAQLLKDLPELSTKKETRMERYITFEDPKDGYLPSMSGTQVDQSSKPNRKCETCDCYKNFLPCDDCSDNDMGCIFTGDSKLCLCCTIKLIVF